MNKKYPNYFITLYDYKIDDKCKNKKVQDKSDFTLKDLQNNQQNIIKNYF